MKYPNLFKIPFVIFNTLSTASRTWHRWPVKEHGKSGVANARVTSSTSLRGLSETKNVKPLQSYLWQKSALSHTFYVIY